MEIYLFLPDRRRLGVFEAMARRSDLQIVRGRLPVRGHFAGREGLLLLLVDAPPPEAGRLTPALRRFMEAALSDLEALEFIWGDAVEGEGELRLAQLDAPLTPNTCYALQR